MDMSVICVLCFLLLYIHICSPLLAVERANTRKAMARFRSVPVRRANSFTSFREAMAKETGIDKRLLSSRVALGVFKRKGRYINLRDTKQRSRLKTILLSALCSSCRGNCSCRRRFGCSC